MPRDNSWWICGDKHTEQRGRDGLHNLMREIEDALHGALTDDARKKGGTIQGIKCKDAIELQLVNLWFDVYAACQLPESRALGINHNTVWLYDTPENDHRFFSELSNLNQFRIWDVWDAPNKSIAPWNKIVLDYKKWHKIDEKNSSGMAKFGRSLASALKKIGVGIRIVEAVLTIIAMAVPYAAPACLAIVAVLEIVQKVVDIAATAAAALLAAAMKDGNFLRQGLLTGAQGALQMFGGGALGDGDPGEYGGTPFGGSKFGQTAGQVMLSLESVGQVAADSGYAPAEVGLVKLNTAKAVLERGDKIWQENRHVGDAAGFQDMTANFFNDAFLNMGQTPELLDLADQWNDSIDLAEKGALPSAWPSGLERPIVPFKRIEKSAFAATPEEVAALRGSSDPGVANGAKEAYRTYEDLQTQGAVGGLQKPIGLGTGLILAVGGALILG